MIIAFAQTKGGVGKTTLAVNLAVERVVRRHHDVLLVDADEQGTASDFSCLRADRLGHTGFTLVQLTRGATVRSQVQTLKDRFDDVVIDAGGRDTSALRAALTLADVAIVPFQPRSFDVWTLDKVATLVGEARMINPKLQAFAIINCADPQGHDNVAAAEALAENSEIIFLDSPIGRRKAFPNCNAIGLSVLEATQPDPKACLELERLADRLDVLCPHSATNQGAPIP
ncbi:AAA family ATPase [Telmatospirillum sp.]|uniref:AAA family ATPase n=1 Tax=Telmatospirillum sp. TaxID=2079197 RepID=UPI00283B0341|nr:AAA family ATPase [Telmatospirillum sp.]MDR3435192.1 AAA family ATPase [Telmatospirillum sp.]